MDSKELVYRAIERTGPARVPIHYCNRDFEFSDVVPTWCGPARGFVPSEPGADEWGCVWDRVDDTMGQVLFHPLGHREHITAYRPPDPFAPGRFDPADAAVASFADRFIKLTIGITGFNLATFLRGFESFMMDLHMDRGRVEGLLDLVFGFENGLIEQLSSRSGIDCVAFYDDWGTQTGLMISPDLWREVFRPRYAEQFERIHAQGKKVWFHSCGNVYDIIGDLIDIGADVLEFLQPDILDVDRLAKEFGGKVCFACSVDHQRVAISGTKEEIFDYARNLNDKLGGPDGGFIAYVEDYASLGMSEENYQWIREAFHSLNA